MHKKPSSNTTESLWTESPWTSNLLLVRLTCFDPFLRRPDLAETGKEEEVKEKAPEERAVEEEEEERDSATDHQGPPMVEEKVEEEEEVGVVEAEQVAEKTDPKCLSRILTNNWKTTPMAAMAKSTALMA